jgi:hypothetical protein
VVVARFIAAIPGSRSSSEGQSEAIPIIAAQRRRVAHPPFLCALARQALQPSRVFKSFSVAVV